MTINHAAPVVQVNKIQIGASPHTVWTILSDINSWGEWNPRIKKPSLKNGLTEGAVFTWKTNGSKITSTIHTIRENRVLGWKGKALGASAIHNWYLEPVENGTRVRVEESMEGWLVRLMKSKMNSIVKNDMEYWLEQLKGACEQ